MIIKLSNPAEEHEWIIINLRLYAGIGVLLMCTCKCLYNI